MINPTRQLGSREMTLKLVKCIIHYEFFFFFFIVGSISSSKIDLVSPPIQSLDQWVNITTNQRKLFTTANSIIILIQPVIENL